MKLSHGVVASAHTLASEAGASVLRKGGNAVDAAVATGLMVGVAEPAFSGIGGGGLALIRLASGETVFFDYREAAPHGASPGMFEVTGGGEVVDRANSEGPLAVAVPSMVAGYARMLEAHGTMKFRDVAKYAVEASKGGVPGPRLSGPSLRSGPEAALQKVRRYEGSTRIFAVGEGSRIRLAERLPLLSATLSGLIEAGPDSFYEGRIPAEVSRHLSSIGGVVDERDFAYFPKVRRPVSGWYGDFEVFSAPPPSAGGTLIIQGLEVLERLQDAYLAAEEGERLWLLSRVLDSILRERGAFGDPDFVDVDVRKLLSGRHIAAVAGEAWDEAGMKGRGRSHEAGSTTHFSVADSKGNVVAATETLECYFGSGVVVPGLGVLLNDEMHDFDPVGGGPNSIVPGKRPASSMSPTIILREGEPYLALGGAGSTRIITSVVQVVANLTMRNLPLGRALSEPRVHPAPEGLVIEGGLGRTPLAALRKRAGKVTTRGRNDLYFGGVHAILFDKGKAVGAADPRRMGKPASE
ncbi:MAG: gamma-glutamyltransferase [Thaumarchaeota archaeon]|nr:gamma-glutamyltransferase [Nitrososphaerota archaeon]